MKNGTIWIAYCTTCGKQLEACANGSFAEAAARMHVQGSIIGDTEELFRAHPFHKVLVGYEAGEAQA